MKKDLRAWSAIGMLAAGVGLSTAGFCVEPIFYILYFKFNLL